RELFARLEQQAAGRLRSWFSGPLHIERSAEMRYGAQVYEIDVPLDGIDWQATTLADEIERRFHNRHEELYTYASRDQEVVFVNARVAAVGRVTPGKQTRHLAASSAACAPRSMRKAYFGTWRDVPVYALETLEPGHAIDGPAIVEAETTTVVINSGDRLTVNDLGWLDIQVRLT
ncbi:MAG: hydantoinase/oxoprolinase family protein, partial [Bradyrhizobium sp.]|nr:hydantoinase/oxoprolinase family protein [Bradyrhizobium sp.]